MADSHLSARRIVGTLDALATKEDGEHRADHRQHRVILHQPRIMRADRGRDDAQLRVVHLYGEILKVGAS